MSSGSSSSSSESEDVEADQVEWFTQRPQGQRHLVQKSVHGRLVPCCRDLAFDAPHAERGGGIDDVSKVLRKCWARAFLALHDAIEE